MKPTSFRLRDKTHVIEMDLVGLITPEIEAALSDAPAAGARRRSSIHRRGISGSGGGGDQRIFERVVLLGERTVPQIPAVGFL
jgi:hypothetical protein